VLAEKEKNYNVMAETKSVCALLWNAGDGEIDEKI
jgi:hypothetical protein